MFKMGGLWKISVISINEIEFNTELKEKNNVIHNIPTS